MDGARDNLIFRDPILVTAEVAAKVRCHPKHWLRLVRSGEAPPPITLGTNRSGTYRKYGWRLSAIEAWITARQRGEQQDAGA